MMKLSPWFINKIAKQKQKKGTNQSLATLALCHPNVVFLM